MNHLTTSQTFNPIQSRILSGNASARAIISSAPSNGSSLAQESVVLGNSVPAPNKQQCGFSLNEALQKLDPAGRKSFESLQAAFTAPPNTDGASRIMMEAPKAQLASLLATGALSAKDSKGTTVLQHLSAMNKDSRNKGELASLISALASNNSFGGSQDGLAAVAQKSPGELARVYRDLALDGQSRLPNGTTATVQKPSKSCSPVQEALLGATAHTDSAPLILAATRKSLENNPKAQAAFQQLSPKDQLEFSRMNSGPALEGSLKIAQAFEAQGSLPIDFRLGKLLESGQLVNQDSVGKSLLENLSSLRQSAGPTSEIYQSVLSKLAPTEFCLKSERRWSSPQQTRLQEKWPAEYVRATQALSAHQSVTLNTGETLQPGAGNAQTLDSVWNGSLLATAVSSGRPMEFTNSDGQTHSLQVRQLSLPDKGEAYQLGLADQKLTVSTEKGLNGLGDQVLKVADYWSQTPPHLRNRISAVHFESGASENDKKVSGNYADFAKSHGGHFTAAAEARKTGMTFFHGFRNLRESTFHHEAGHYIGGRRQLIDGLVDLYNFKNDHNSPVGWVKRTERDGHQVSDYAKVNAAESFAEAWSNYKLAQTHGQDALNKFRKDFPNQSATIERIYKGGTW